MTEDVLIDAAGHQCRPGTAEHLHEVVRRPSLSHGRSKSVVVETKRARIVDRPRDRATAALDAWVDSHVGPRRGRAREQDGAAQHGPAYALKERTGS